MIMQGDYEFVTLMYMIGSDVYKEMANMIEKGYAVHAMYNFEFKYGYSNYTIVTYIRKTIPL